MLLDKEAGLISSHMNHVAGRKVQTAKAKGRGASPDVTVNPMWFMGALVS